MDFTPAETGTLAMALIAWVGRCNHEAATMRQLAIEFSDDAQRASKALANAAASDALRADAEALLQRLRRA